MQDQQLEYAIGVDLGGTKIEFGLVDNLGRIHDHQRCETQVHEGPAFIEKQIVENVQMLLQKSDVPILGIGIGMAGQIQPKTGLVIFAPNLKWHHFPLQANVENALKIPTRVMNDVRAITLGEWLYGAGKGCQDLVCAFIGTGIGSGVVSEGRLLTGWSNTFGEIGHMTIDLNGPLCTCGKQGCLEAIAGGWGIAARAQEAIEANDRGAESQNLLKLAGGNLKSVTAKTVIEAYRLKDPLAEGLMQNIQKALIAGFASIVNAYNPRCLILGGGFIDGMPEMIQIIDRGIKESALKAATHSLEVVKAQLGKQTGVVGSAAYIFNGFKQKGSYKR